MTDLKNKMEVLFTACWKDDDLKSRFILDPKGVLAEYDMHVPEDVEVKVVENSENHVHITMPSPPPGHDQLTDDELSSVAGGTCSAWMWTSFMQTSTACPETATAGMPSS